MEGQSRPTWVVDGNSVFDPYECLESRLLQAIWPPGNPVIRVVSIVGPQTTGKSYLLNKVFGTNFNVVERDWGQETQGIWIQKCDLDPPMLIMDIEGSDSRRSEGKTLFENRAALLALTISNAMLLNFKAEGIGQYCGGCVPLLRTIFKERVKHDKAKTLIVVTLRDCKMHDGVTNEEEVKRKMREIWDDVHGSDPNPKIFQDYVEVSVVQFPHYRVEEDREVFENKCSELRNLVTTGELMRPGTLKLTPPTVFDAFKELWGQIKSNNELCIPSLQVFISERYCKKVQMDILESLVSDENYEALLRMDDSTSLEAFYGKLTLIVDSALERFEVQTSGQVLHVMNETKKDLGRSIFNKPVIVGNFIPILDATKKESESKMCSQMRNSLWNKKKSYVSSIFTFSFDTTAFDRHVVQKILNSHLQEIDNLYEGFPWPKEYEALIGQRKTEQKEALRKTLREEEQKIQGRHTYIVLGAKAAICLVIVLAGSGVIYTKWAMIITAYAWFKSMMVDLNINSESVMEVINVITKLCKEMQKNHYHARHATSRAATNYIARTIPLGGSMSRLMIDMGRPATARYPPGNAMIFGSVAAMGVLLIQYAVRVDIHVQ